GAQICTGTLAGLGRVSQESSVRTRRGSGRLDMGIREPFTAADEWDKELTRAYVACQHGATRWYPVVRPTVQQPRGQLSIEGVIEPRDPFVPPHGPVAHPTRCRQRH